MDIIKLLKEIATELEAKDYDGYHQGVCESAAGYAKSEAISYVGQTILEHIEYAEKKEQNEK